MDKQEKIIMYESDEAASIKTVTGWVSSKGHFYGKDEDLARFDGATHKKCECGNIKEIRSYCRYCSERRSHKKYLNMAPIDWDGVTPLCINGTDEYFFDAHDLINYCEANETTPQELQLVICEPNYLKQVDVYRYLEANEVPEEYKFPEEIQKAFDQLNKQIKKYSDPISWSQGSHSITKESLPYMEKENG